MNLPRLMANCESGFGESAACQKRRAKDRKNQGNEASIRRGMRVVKD
jgi:hypothetical protein